MTSDLPPLRETIEQFGLGAKKSLGQHFLLDLNITRKIARLVDVGAHDQVLEIGPGPGGLTRALLETGANVTAIERDARCIEALADLSAHHPGKLHVIEDDALRFDETSLSHLGPLKIIANLPYNISTELLIKWLKQGSSRWSVMALMFQKEVADRILSAPGTKTYGRLSVISQILSTPRRGFDLPARAFTPPPKVDSTVVLFDAASATFPEPSHLEQVTQAAFSQRRKMVRSSLKKVFSDHLENALEAADALPTQRAEELSVDQYRALAAFHAVSKS